MLRLTQQVWLMTPVLAKSFTSMHSYTRPQSVQQPTQSSAGGSPDNIYTYAQLHMQTFNLAGHCFTHTHMCFTWPLEQWSERSSLCFLLLNCTVVFLLCTGSAPLHCTNVISAMPCHAMPCQYKSLHYKLNYYCFELFSYDTCPTLRKSFIWHGSLLKIPPDHYVNETDISHVVEYLWGLNCLSRKRTYH